MAVNQAKKSSENRLYNILDTLCSDEDSKRNILKFNEQKKITQLNEKDFAEHFVQLCNIAENIEKDKNVLDPIKYEISITLLKTINQFTPEKAKIIHDKLEKTGNTKFSSLLTEKIFSKKIKEFKSAFAS